MVILSQIKEISPVEILYDFDGPKIFTVKDKTNNLLLLYQCYEDDKLRRFLMVPTNDDTIRLLKSNELAVYVALKQPWSWYLDIINDDVIFIRPVNINDVPVSYFPKSDVLLRR